MTCSFPREWTREGEKGQKNIPATPSSLPPALGAFFPATGPQPHQAHGTAGRPTVREIPSASRQPMEATGALALRSAAAPSPAGKGFKGRQAQPVHFPREKTGPERGPETSEPLDKSVAERRSPVDSAGLWLCPAPVPLPGATSAAPPLLPSRSTSLVPTSANSPLSRLPPTSCWQPATRIAGKDGQCRVTTSPLPPFISSPLFLSSLHSPIPNKGSTLPWA